MTPVRSQGGLVGRVLLLRDITAAEEGEHAKSQFMSAVSHELRTPLTSITMGIGLLAESKDILKNERERELVDILVADARRLSKLVDDLFEVARLQKGQLPLTFSKVDVAELVNEVVKPFTQQSECRGVGLLVDLPAGLPPARADAEKLAWVLSNLVGNALRYTPAGGTITISAQQHASKLYVSVADTGEGIPKDKQEAIFEPYVQVGTDRKGGAGLGLSISRDLIRAHGGRIWVESEPGKGSTFTFSLSIDT
jgi:signal transduction histidine kinase